MIPTASSEQNRRAEQRRQEKMLAFAWLPFSLLFHLWVFLTPTDEKKLGLLQPSGNHTRPRPVTHISLLTAALVVISVLGFSLLALLTLPPLTSRLILTLTFGFCLWQLMRPKT